MADFAALRRTMVDGQVRTADVTDRSLIQAMSEVPRERFVPEQAEELAYLDLDLPVGAPGQGRRLLKPMVLGKMLQALNISSGERALDVGCATGYGAAVLARLAGSVVALEEDADLARQAAATLGSLGVENVTVVQGPLAAGHVAPAPYDVILVEGRVELAPEKLCRQLADGGRLVCIQGAGPAAKATLYQRDGDDITSRQIFDASGPVLPGFAQPAAFVF